MVILAIAVGLLLLALVSGVAQFVRAERRAERIRRALDETDEAGA